MNTDNENNTLVKKSTFVNVLAWIFIILGGFSTFISILQNIMIHTFFNMDEMKNSLSQTEEVAADIPFFAQLMFNYMDLFFLFFLLLSATSFISAIALLKRKNWARIIFIILMSIGIIWNICSLVMQFTMFQKFPQEHQAPPEFESMMRIMQFASVVMVTAFCALFGFVIKKLCSEKIKQEFV